MRAHHGCSRIVVCLKTKSGEAAGVFSAAMEHHKNVDGKDISKNSDLIEEFKSQLKSFDYSL